MTNKTETTGASERTVRVEGDVSRPELTKYPEGFQRETRYLVLKIKDVVAALSSEEVKQLIDLHGKVADTRRKMGKQMLSCVVVESDWPEYEPTWSAIEARMTANAIGEGPGAAFCARSLSTDGLEGNGGNGNV